MYNENAEGSLFRDEEQPGFDLKTPVARHQHY